MYDNVDYVNILSRYRLDFEAKVIDKLIEYNRLIIDYPANLTAYKDYARGFEALIIDSIIAVINTMIMTDEVSKIVDIGTGGGIPGIPLAIIFPEKNFYLVDSTAKKTNAVALFCKTLNLENVEVFNERIEDFAHKHRNFFDFGTCRALGRTDITLEYLACMIKNQGLIGLYKGPAYYAQEKKYADKASNMLGLKEDIIYSYRFYEKDEEKTRLYVTFRKIGNTASKYPRKNGVPANEPLAGE